MKPYGKFRRVNRVFLLAEYYILGASWVNRIPMFGNNGELWWAGFVNMRIFRPRLVSARSSIGQSNAGGQPNTCLRDCGKNARRTRQRSFRSLCRRCLSGSFFRQIRQQRILWIARHGRRCSRLLARRQPRVVVQRTVGQQNHQPHSGKRWLSASLHHRLLRLIFFRTRATRSSRSLLFS